MRAEEVDRVFRSLGEAPQHRAAVEIRHPAREQHSAADAASTHPRSAALPSFDQAVAAKDVIRRDDRASAHRKCLGQCALGWQTRARRQVVSLDRRLQGLSQAVVDRAGAVDGPGVERPDDPGLPVDPLGVHLNGDWI